jgi:signal transduction histidine kinase
LSHPSLLSLLVAAMIVLLPVLAALQYRWLGQLSDAERERMQRTLRAETEDFTKQVDLELARAIVGLQIDAATVHEQAWQRYAEKYAAWAATSQADVVAEVLLVDAPDAAGVSDPLRLRRWNAAAAAFEPAPWPGALGAMRDRLRAELAEFRRDPEPLFARPSDLLSEDGSTLLIPAAAVAPLPASGEPPRFVPLFAFTVIRLDLHVFSTQVVPAAVARHFGTPDRSDYDLAVVSRERPSRVIYESGPGDAKALEQRAEVDEPFFGMRPDSGYALMRTAMGSLRAREGHEGPEAGDRRNVFFSVFQRRGGGEAPGVRPPSDKGARWRLLVRHRAGSLEAAVAQARQRNLALSFGILVLMALSVALIVVAARRAQRLARQQIEFVAGVSHELRTPVAVIGAAADNLSQGVITEPSRVRQYGAAIQGEARRLGETVERVLQFAGIQAGRGIGHRVPVALGPLVAETLAASGGILGDAGAEVETDVPADLPPVLADPTALRAAFQNLVANAVKYGGPARWLRVSARTVQARRGREIEVAVEDRGLGIAPADLPHVFEPFYRGADALERQIHGNGLGLSIVKGVVEAHGGRVGVTSTPGAGSRFTIRLPEYRAQPAAHHAADAVPQQAAGRG